MGVTVMFINNLLMNHAAHQRGAGMVTIGNNCAGCFCVNTRCALIHSADMVVCHRWLPTLIT